MKTSSRSQGHFLSRQLPCAAAWLGLALALLAAMTPIAQSFPVTFLIRTNDSVANLTLQVLGKSDTQPGRLTGTLTVDLDAWPQPSAVAVDDFEISLAAPMDFAIDFGFSGKGTARVNELKLVRHDPPVKPEFVTIGSDGSLTVTNLIYTTSGDGNYKVSGLVCTLVQSGGRPCADTVDFDNGPPAVIDTLSGTLTFSGGLATLKAHYFFTQPLDPTNPDLATVVGESTLTAVASLLSPSLVKLDSEAGPMGIVLRWGASPADLKLYSSDSLEPGAVWTPVAESPALVDGQLRVVVSPSDARRFFRLQLP